MNEFVLTAEQLRSLFATENLLVSSSLKPNAAVHGFTPQAFISDSRKAAPNTCFIAYKGTNSDSHSYLAEVVAKGACLLVVEQKPSPQLEKKVSWLQVRSSRAAMAWLFAALYGHPERYLRFFGVTGTNGKTSTVWLTKALLRCVGKSSLSCGTLGYYLGEQHFASSHTTPDPDALFPVLQKARTSTIDTVLMEVSSHSLVQEKLRAVRFAAAGFTSFSQDHLDFHGDFDAYWQAKWLLFSSYLAPGAPAFFHSSLLPRLLQEDYTSLHAYIYGCDIEDSDWPVERKISLKILSESPQGSTIRFTFQGVSYQGVVPLWGAYSCENFLLAWLLAYTCTKQAVASSYWPSIPPVPGRLQRVPSTNTKASPAVFVDYAHTPDALQQALTVLRRQCKGKLWVVFGCGGGRDQGKRKIMGKIASELADFAIVTADNPRNEALQDINAAICSGFPAHAPAHVIEDRRTAISYALTHAAAADSVLIAGKGHETTQTIGDKVVPFNDFEVARTILS